MDLSSADYNLDWGDWVYSNFCTSFLLVVENYDITQIDRIDSFPGIVPVPWTQAHWQEINC